MPRLIHLNGPAACGKSTLARRYVEDHPLALDLDLDQLRDLLGNWREHRPDAGRLTRDFALAAAHVHLAAGHDVVVPQLVGRVVFIDKLAALARETGATFHELVLIDSKPNMLRRFRQRRAHPNSDQRARTVRHVRPPARATPHPPQRPRHPPRRRPTRAGVPAGFERARQLGYLDPVRRKSGSGS